MITCVYLASAYINFMWEYFNWYTCTSVHSSKPHMPMNLMLCIILSVKQPIKTSGKMREFKTYKTHPDGYRFQVTETLDKYKQVWYLSHFESVRIYILVRVNNGEPENTV